MILFCFSFLILTFVCWCLFSSLNDQVLLSFWMISVDNFFLSVFTLNKNKTKFRLKWTSPQWWSEMLFSNFKAYSINLHKLSSYFFKCWRRFIAQLNASTWRGGSRWDYQERQDVQGCSVVRLSNEQGKTPEYMSIVKISISWLA